MKRYCKRIVCCTMSILFFSFSGLQAMAAPELESPSYVLMEASTGQIIYEKEGSQRTSPASITKIMTLLVIFDELAKGNVDLTDEVITSEYAKSMGGSQVYLETGEIQTLDTIIKCIAVASGNDASVAAAEHIAGSETEFVSMMNERAEELGLADTHFEDCCGLSESDNHYTSAKDVALMARELITKYPKIYEYSTIWMEDIVHVTNKGSETFTLASTNKLLKQYPYATGLKTGSTDKAKYCLAATAHYEGMDLIAVIMAAPDYKIRFAEAQTLLEYGFSQCSLYTDTAKISQNSVQIIGAVKKEAAICPQSGFAYLNTTGDDISGIAKEVKLPGQVEAPVRIGEKTGEIEYYLNGNKIGSVALIFTEDIEKASYADYFLLSFRAFLL